MHQVCHDESLFFKQNLFLELVSLWCANPRTFHAAVLTAQKLGFVNGEYVFIYLDTVLTQEK